MADTVYRMNQYIYKGNNDCMTAINYKLMYLDWQIQSEGSPFYRDVLIQLLDSDGNNLSFEANKTYYLSFGIPRNLNYDLNFSVKLLQSFNNYIYDVTKTPFQFIKYISTRRTSDDGTTNSLVCLYEINEENEKGKVRLATRYGNASDINLVMPQRPYSIDDFKKANLTSRYFYEINSPVGETNETYTYWPYVLYHDRQHNNRYWMFNGTAAKTARWNNGNIDDPMEREEAQILAGTNDTILNWTWQQKTVANMAYYKMIIKPTMNLNYVLLQMERITEDNDIITDQRVGAGKYKTAENQRGQGEIVYGRYVDLDQNTGNTKDGTLETVADTFKVYELNDLMKSQLGVNNSPITRFGIWSHPELMMAINGEEIQIGSSGYYELNDFEVKELCVVASGSKDIFTLDYQYLA